VLFAGAVDEPRKGVGLLLDAAELLLGDHPDLELWLLGPGDVSSHLAHRPSALRRAVSRCGPVGDEALRAAYATAWVTALPSVAEAFGMTIVESWASGTPAVVRADSGGPAELGVDGDLGRTCAGTAPDLAAALGECLELARRPATSERCRERAAGYDWDRVVVPMLVDLYAGAAA
jgi:phosphatidylinositol alpha-mannosyltransferase